MKMIVCFMLAASCATVSMAQDGGNGGAERRGVRFTGGPVADERVRICPFGYFRRAQYYGYRR